MPSRLSPLWAPSTEMRAAFLMFVGAGLVAGTASVAADAHDVTIKMQKEAYVPATATVAAGMRIVWTNTDTMPHSVTANDQRFDSGAIAPGKSFEWTADAPGAIAYHCIFHPSMTAVLTVRAAAK